MERLTVGLLDWVGGNALSPAAGTAHCGFCSTKLVLGSLSVWRHRSPEGVLWAALCSSKSQWRWNDVNVENLDPTGLGPYKKRWGASPQVLQWWGLCVVNATGTDSVPGQGTKIPHAVQHGKKKKSKHCIWWGEKKKKENEPTPVFLPGKSHRQRSLVSYSPRGCKESGTTMPMFNWISAVHLKLTQHCKSTILQ